MQDPPLRSIIHILDLIDRILSVEHVNDSEEDISAQKVVRNHLRFWREEIVSRSATTPPKLNLG